MTRLHALHVFRARVAAGDKAATEIVRLADAAGVRICPYPKIAEPGETLAAGTLEFVHKTWGPDILGGTLKLLMDAGGAGNLIKATIHGTAIALADNSSWLGKLHEGAKALRAAHVKSVLERALRQQIDLGQREYTCFARELVAVLSPVLGQEERPATSASPRKPTKAKADRDRAERLARTQEAHRLTMERASQPQSTPINCGADERALIEEAIRAGKVRKVDAGATGDPYHLIEWLKRDCGIEARRLTPAQCSKGRIFEVGKRKITKEQFYELVNEQRRKRKLQPITVAA